MIQPLLYKAWLETRFRFLASVLLLLAIILFGVMRAEGIMHDVAATRTLAKVNYTQYVWIILYKGYLLTIFIFQVSSWVSVDWQQKKLQLHRALPWRFLLREQIIFIRDSFWALCS